MKAQLFNIYVKVCEHAFMGYVLCWCTKMQSVLNVLRNDEDKQHRHGNLADNETSKQAAEPAATSHPVVIFWKLPVLLLLIPLCSIFS